VAAGPIFPFSEVPVDSGAGGRVFNFLYQGSNQGGTVNAGPQECGYGVVSSYSTDNLAKWVLRFKMPAGSSAPSGTLYADILMLANATSGVAKMTVSDGVVSPSGGIPSGVTLTGETQVSVTWTTGSNDAYQRTRLALSSSWQEDGVLVMVCTMNYSGYTLATNLWFTVSIIWE
jgi:hypothetical protein